MNETELEELLQSLIEQASDALDEDERVRCEIDPPEGLAQIARVRTFEDEGVLSANRGLVLRMADGSEYQLSIVCSR